MAIQFFDEDSGFKLKDKNLHKKWLKELANKKGYKVGELTYIFCSDEYLFNINVEYQMNYTIIHIYMHENHIKNISYEDYGRFNHSSGRFSHSCGRIRVFMCRALNHNF